MNQLLPYEQQIAEKVLQAPVANMADAIWSRIELELDTDLPGDNGNEPSSPTGGGSPARGFRFYIAGGIIIGAAILTFLLTKNKNKVVPEPSSTLPVREENTNRVVPGANDNKTVPGKNSSGNVPYDPAAKPGSNNIIIPSQGQGLLPDSLLNPPLYNIMPDSAKRSDPVLVIAPPANDPPAKAKEDSVKKPRGVKGITDNDYLIKAEKKDSTKR